MGLVHQEVLRGMNTGTYQAISHEAFAGAARPRTGSGATAWAIHVEKSVTCDFQTVMNARARRLQESSQ